MRPQYRSLDRETKGSRQGVIQPQKTDAGGKKQKQNKKPTHTHTHTKTHTKTTTIKNIKKNEQAPNYPQPKPSLVQSAVWSAHQGSDSTATNGCARDSPHPPQILSSEESASIVLVPTFRFRLHPSLHSLPGSRSPPGPLQRLAGVKRV